MPRVASPVCVTYAAPAAGGWAAESTVPWHFEEPVFKKPRLSADLRPPVQSVLEPRADAHGGVPLAAAPVAAAARSAPFVAEAEKDSSRKIRKTVGTEVLLSFDSAADDEDATADINGRDAADLDYRSFCNLGQLPPKRARIDEAVWWSERLAEEGIRDAIIPLPNSRRSCPSTFVWGPLPPPCEDVVVGSLSPSVRCTEESDMDCSSLPSVKADELQVIPRDVVTLCKNGPTREVAAACAANRCMALVPYLGQLAAANWLRATGPTPLLMPRMFRSDAPMNLPVHVLEVVVDEMSVLRAIVVHRSQALLAARRLGQTIRDVEQYQSLNDGHVLLPVPPRD